MIGRAPFATVPGEPNPPSTDPIALLNYALRHPESVSLVNFAGSVLWTSRGEPADANGPAIGPYVAVEAPVEVQEDLDGPPELQDAYVLIHIPRAVLDEMDSPVARPLILLPPGVGRPS